jgi:hypothetical protein
MLNNNATRKPVPLIFDIASILRVIEANNPTLKGPSMEQDVFKLAHRRFENSLNVPNSVLEP